MRNVGSCLQWSIMDGKSSHHKDTVREDVKVAIRIIVVLFMDACIVSVMIFFTYIMRVLIQYLGVADTNLTSLILDMSSTMAIIVYFVLAIFSIFSIFKEISLNSKK